MLTSCSELAADVQALSITDSLGFRVAAEQSPTTENVSSRPRRSGKKRGRKSNANDTGTDSPGDPRNAKRAKTSHAQAGTGNGQDDPSTRKSHSIEKLKQVLDLCDSLGIRYIDRDCTKISSWALLSSSCCLTTTHQDAAGYFTFVKCETGMKLWCYLVPKDSSADIADAMKQIITVLEDSENTETICDHAELVSLVLTPGTVV